MRENIALFTDEIRALAVQIMGDGQLIHASGDGRRLFQIMDLLAKEALGQGVTPARIGAYLLASLHILAEYYEWDHPAQDKAREAQVLEMYVRLWLLINQKRPVRTPVDGQN